MKPVTGHEQLCSGKTVNPTANTTAAAASTTCCEVASGRRSVLAGLYCRTLPLQHSHTSTAIEIRAGHVQRNQKQDAVPRVRHSEHMRVGRYHKRFRVPNRAVSNAGARGGGRRESNMSKLQCAAG